MLRFLHAQIHVAQVIERSLLERELVYLPCPVCRMWYIADLDPRVADVDLLRAGRRAARRLSQECPDHAHQFVV